MLATFAFLHGLTIPEFEDPVSFPTLRTREVPLQLDSSLLIFLQECIGKNFLAPSLSNTSQILSFYSSALDSVEPALIQTEKKPVNIIMVVYVHHGHPYRI